MNVKEILNLTANKLKQSRMKAGMSMEELAKLSGLSVYKIRKIETGEYNFQLKEFNKISKFLNIKLILKKRK